MFICNVKVGSQLPGYYAADIMVDFDRFLDDNAAVPLNTGVSGDETSRKRKQQGERLISKPSRKNC
jgi:hypothetical protein